MTCFSSIWPYARPRPGRRLRQRRAITGLFRPECPWVRRWTWRDRLAGLADRVAYAFAATPLSVGWHVRDRWALGLCFGAHALILGTVVGLFASEAPPLPCPRDLPPAGARWVIPVAEMPIIDDAPEPPLVVERGTQ